MAKQYSLHMWVWAAQTLYVQCRSVTRALRNNLKTENNTTEKENVDRISYILLCLNHNFRSFVDVIYFVHWISKGSELYLNYRSLSYDVTAAMLVYRNNSCGTELFSYVKRSFVPRNRHSYQPREHDLWKGNVRYPFIVKACCELYFRIFFDVPRVSNNYGIAPWLNN